MAHFKVKVTIGGRREATPAFRRDLRDVFASARTMVGGEYPPDEMDEQRERITLLEKKLFRILRGL